MRVTPKKRGPIALLASVLATLALVNLASYSPSRGASTTSVAREKCFKGIRITVVYVGRAPAKLVEQLRSLGANASAVSAETLAREDAGSGIVLLTPEACSRVAGNATLSARLLLERRVVAVLDTGRGNAYGLLYRLLASAYLPLDFWTSTYCMGSCNGTWMAAIIVGDARAGTKRPYPAHLLLFNGTDAGSGLCYALNQLEYWATLEASYDT